MKKGIMLAVVAGSLFASCGEKFTPMTEEQINAKVEEFYNEQKDAKLQELNAACQAKAEAEATAKFEAMKSEATASK